MAAPNDERGERRASMAVVYFGIGFALAAGLTAVALVLARPVLVPQDAPPFIRTLAMWGPLITGIPYGGRVAWFGMREDLRLGKALLRALRP